MIRTAPVKRRRGHPRRGPASIPDREWRNAAYRLYLSNTGRCAICFAPGCDPAHGPSNGMASKGPDSGCIPLCRPHHNEQHAIGWPTFERLHAINRAEIAAKWWNRFKAGRLAA